MAFFHSYLFISISLFLVSLAASTSQPTAQVKNGTYIGLHNDYYNVDYFLGMRFAQPPVGELRLALPASLNTSFSGVQNATEFGPGCIGFSAAEINRPIAEDCLSINVYRPAGFEGQQLPVLVWIFGGGFIQGLNSDPRYNLTFMVQNSVNMGKPIVAASINYRLNGFGFLDGTDIRKAGVTNLGLHDQRLALQWVQENIDAFGGDPSKVTIWGQSAGAMSVGAHLLAYGGRDDKLFRAAIADSGGPIGGQPPSLNQSDTTFNTIASRTGCGSAVDKLSCLRKVPISNFTAAVNATSASYAPIFDGEFLPTFSSSQLKNSQFLKVPLLIGSNVDEGTNFIGSAPSIGANPTRSYPNTTSFLTAAAGYIKTTNSSLVSSALQALAILYPDIPSIGIPHTFHGRPNATWGAQYKRVAALAGDMTIHRGRRLAAQSWAESNTPVYSYHFAAFPIGGLPNLTGTTHFSEIALVMDDEAGNGYIPPWYPSGSPYAGQGTNFYTLARLMSRMWLSFTHDLTPNNHGIDSFNGTKIPTWPIYASSVDDASEGYGVNLRFDQNVPGLTELEKDNWRAEAIDFLIQNSAEIFGN